MFLCTIDALVCFNNFILTHWVFNILYEPNCGYRIEPFQCHPTSPKAPKKPITKEKKKEEEVKSPKNDNGKRRASQIQESIKEHETRAKQAIKDANSFA